MCKSIIKQVVGQWGAYSSQIGEQTSKRVCVWEGGGQNIEDNMRVTFTLLFSN